MRKLCLLLVPVVVLAAATPVVAAEDEPLFGPMTPARTSGEWVHQGELVEAVVDQSSELMMSAAGGRSSYLVSGDDPRFGGVAEVTGGWDGFWPPALVAVVEQDWVVSDGDGSWTGSNSFVSSMADNDPINQAEQLFLDGSGAYEGLTAYVIVDHGEETFVGVILPDEMPELPDDWLEILEASAEDD